MWSEIKKYVSFPKINLKNRVWPDKEITKAPIWASVDLRDWNQALIKPMNLQEKLKLFNLLVEVGFKQIEIGFPSASKTEFEFTRYLIENDLIPDDVTIQVLIQTREHLIEKTAESLKWAKNVIVHIYNSTSVDQRELVFKKSKKEIIDIAVNWVKWVQKYFSDFTWNLQLQYSPESFTGTELEFAKEICDSVVSQWNPKKWEKVIINIPGTVENSTVNIFADMIEWMHTNLKQRKNIILSLHNHNDRWTWIAATELGLLAWADRVEWTLLWNWERTWNTDILTMWLNLFTQWIDPELDFSNVDKIKEIIEEITQIKTSKRHPYVGELVHTAFSWSHQDAIKKWMDWQKNNPEQKWRVPYLPIDPKDIWKSYEAIIQINSQSGKWWTAYVLDAFYWIKLTREEQIKMWKLVQEKNDSIDRLLKNEEIYEIYKNNFN